MLSMKTLGLSVSWLTPYWAGTAVILVLMELLLMLVSQEDVKDQDKFFLSATKGESSHNSDN